MDSQQDYSSPNQSQNANGNRQRNFNHPYKRQNYFQQNRGMNRFGPFSPQNQNNSRFQNYRNGNSNGNFQNRNYQNNRNFYNNSARKFTPFKVKDHNFFINFMLDNEVYFLI